MRRGSGGFLICVVSCGGLFLSGGRPETGVSGGWEPEGKGAPTSGRGQIRAGQGPRASRRLAVEPVERWLVSVDWPGKNRARADENRR